MKVRSVFYERKVRQKPSNLYLHTWQPRDRNTEGECDENSFLKDTVGQLVCSRRCDDRLDTPPPTYFCNSSITGGRLNQRTVRSTGWPKSHLTLNIYVLWVLATCLLRDTRYITYFSWKSVEQELSCSLRTDMTELTVALCNFANAPIKRSCVVTEVKPVLWLLIVLTCTTDSRARLNRHAI
jgi:hypothetical protein